MPLVYVTRCRPACKSPSWVWLLEPTLVSVAQMGECALHALTVQNMAWSLESKIPFERSRGLDQLRCVYHSLMTCIVVFYKQPKLTLVPRELRSGGIQHDGDFDHYSIYCLYIGWGKGKGLFGCILVVFFCRPPPHSFLLVASTTLNGDGLLSLPPWAPSGSRFRSACIACIVLVSECWFLI